MSIRNQIGAALVFAAGTFCVAQTAVADHHIKSGSFQIVFSGVTALTTVEYPDSSITAGSLEGTMTTIASSGGPFVAGDTGIYSGVLYAKKSAAGMDLEGPGTTTDSSGDKWFMTGRRTAGGQEVGGGGAGRLEIIGGTGKYEGITGDCEYTVVYLPENRIVTTGTCEWQRN